MKPKQSPVDDKQMDLFEVELAQIVNPNHPMVRLSKAVDWNRLGQVLGVTYCPDNMRTGASTRLMMSLHYLKFTWPEDSRDSVSITSKELEWLLAGLDYRLAHQRLEYTHIS